jgi:hypothetical protein
VLGFAAGDSNGLVLGTFRVNALQNLAHLALAAGIVLGSRRYLRWAGVACLTLWLAGVIGLLDRVRVNAADNWLHLLLGLALLALLALTSREDLGDDLESDLGRRLASEVEPDRAPH